MGNREEARRWLDQARADLRTARDCLKAGHYYASAFFAQQAAEKVLKGFLYSRGFRALITHSVVDLLEQAGKEEPSFRDLIDMGRELDRHYIGSRYPDFYPAGAPYRYYTEEMARRCVRYAASILSLSRRFIKK
ncbi:MAG: HEPN domain-containing protein [Acidobacteria bacterium]|nr:HEPN domain-containing protein [Acidobacteriota bacterium]MDW7985438.1 HEPN domain-containing protein [Acidobacteriota bacterium]